ncbi:MAG: hypothetical protein ABI866_10785 [Dokdonella sp.]
MKNLTLMWSCFAWVWLAITWPSVAVCGVDPFSPDESRDAKTRQNVALGSHTLLGQEEGSGVSPAVTSPINTQANGSSFIAFNAGYASNNAIPTDNKGNVWSAFGAPAIYRGYGGVFDVKAYVVLAGHGGASHSVSIIKNGNASGELTLPFIEIANAAELIDVASNYPPAGTTATSASVTTTGPATLIAFWWGDGGGLVHSAIPDSGFTIIENFVLLPPNSAVQGVVAYREVAAAGTYHVTWTQSPEEGAPLWLFAFQSGTDRIFSNGFD